MAIDTKRVAIGGAQYAITQLGAVAGRGLFKKFVTAMGPLLRDAVSGPLFNEFQTLLKGLGDDVTMAEMAIKVAPLVAPVFIRAIEDMPQPLFEELCDAFTSTTQVLAGKPATMQPLDALFDEHFAGNYAGLMGWFGRCLMVNGFLANLGGGKSPAPQTAQATA
jgi:hypothetical protein